MRTLLHRIYITLGILPLLFFSQDIAAQVIDPDPHQISWEQQDEAVQFQSHLRPLRQIAGAPETFYTYFWEFGDGDFSFNEEPQHAFPDTGDYTIRLFATNNYDDGKAPPTRPRKIKIKSPGALASNYNHSGFFKGDHQLQLKVNRMPKPGEDMVCIIGYKNPKANEQSFNGSIVFFYNDKKFKKKNFGLTDLRKYHQESSSSIEALLAQTKKGQTVPLYALNEVSAHGPHPLKSTKTVSSSTATSLLLQKQSFFDNQNAFHVKDLAAHEPRYVFAVLQTTPEMIKDTNATVTLSAMMIPDNPEDPILETNLELQIVASHDPNRMMLSNRYLNYRFLGNNRKLKYKIKFQNTGKGPASKVDVGVQIPEELDPSALEITEMYPKCVPCATAYSGQSCLDTLISKDSIHFIFRNIYLPGVRQKNVEDKDSTKGFVRYRLKFKEKPQKVPFYSQAAIVFDRNEPIYTNKMHTRFFPGISPAIIAGYQMGFQDPNHTQSPFIIGASLSPYSPYKTYFQVELFAGINGEKTFSSFKTLPKPIDTMLIFDTNSGQREGQFAITKTGNIVTKKLLTLNIVPVEVRRNLSDWFGIGVGLWVKGNLYEKTSKIPAKYAVPIQHDNPTDLPALSDRVLKFPKKESKPSAEHFTHLNPGAFLDINIGKVRVGPSVGFRLFHFFHPNQNGLMMYATWRL